VTRTIAVTGGTGLVGKLLVERLLARGDGVRALTRRPAGERDERPGLRWVEGRLDQREALAELVQGADAIIHAAYEDPGAAPPTERTASEHWLETNLMSSLRLLELTSATSMRQLVYVSSLAVYGHDFDADPLAGRAPRDEDYPLWPPEIYGALRAATEKFVITAARQHGLLTSAFRLGHVVGLRAPHTSSALYATVEEAVRTRRIESVAGSYVIAAGDVADALVGAIGDASTKGRVYNTFDRWFDHADVAPWIAARLGADVAVERPAAQGPTHPIIGERIRERMSFTTDAALRALTDALVDRCSEGEARADDDRDS
jgi:nucleoside-diphosphate-sugar epimerase